MMAQAVKIRSSVQVFRLCVCVLLALCAPSLQAFDSGSTGADGILAPQEDVLVVLPEDGILNYSSVSIPRGVTVRFTRNRANTPVRMLVSGDVEIGGAIDISGQSGADMGIAGDGNAADDGMPGAGGPGGYDGGAGGIRGLVDAISDQAALDSVAGSFGKGPGGGVGGGYFATGGTPRACASSGGNHADDNFRVGTSFRSRCSSADASSTIAPYGTASLFPLTGGSGGGGGAGRPAVVGAGGGGGGGAILIAVSGSFTLYSRGRVAADGGNGGDEADSGADEGGGGSGGAVRIVATTITGSGYIHVHGGNSSIRRSNSRRFDGAGDGRIRLEADNLRYRNSLVRHSRSTPAGPVFLSNRPRLSIGSVASVTPPPALSGREDITLAGSSDPSASVHCRWQHSPGHHSVFAGIA